MVGISEWLVIGIVLALLFPSVLIGIVAYFVGFKRGSEQAVRDVAPAAPADTESEDEDA
jgi:hypothetical protein